MCALWQTKTSLTFQNLSFSECLQRSLREQSENLLPVSSGAASRCVRHGERNEKAAMCDRKWQVGRAGQRLSTKAIRGAGQERREACLFYPHGSIEKHGHALGNQHLAWFKIFLTKSLKNLYQPPNTEREEAALSAFKLWNEQKFTRKFKFASLLLFTWHKILYLTGPLLPWRRTVSNVRRGKFRRGMWLPWKQPQEWGWSFQGTRKKTQKYI